MKAVTKPAKAPWDILIPEPPPSGRAAGMR
jgi:hypothetical protein